MILALVLAVICSFLAYWVVRLAVAHGMREALRRDLLTRLEDEVVEVGESLDAVARR